MWTADATSAPDLTSDGDTGSVLDESAATIDESSLEDMQALPSLTDASFMHTLQRRFEANHVYTYSGPRIAVSVNPYNWEVSLPLYSQEQRDAYRNEQHVEGGVRLPPHLYAVAETARRQRSPQSSIPGGGSGRSQSLLVSGESGAGKTEAVKIMLQYLAQQGAATQAARSANGLIERLIELNPLLEAFGNVCRTPATAFRHCHTRATARMEAHRLLRRVASAFCVHRLTMPTHTPRLAGLHLTQPQLIPIWQVAGAPLWPPKPDPL